MSTLHVWLLAAFGVIATGYPWLAWYWSQTGPNQMNARARRRAQRTFRG